MTFLYSFYFIIFPQRLLYEAIEILSFYIINGFQDLNSYDKNRPGMQNYNSSSFQKAQLAKNWDDQKTFYETALADINLALKQVPIYEMNNLVYFFLS